MDHVKENIIEITDFDIPELEMYTKLKDAQLIHYFEPELGVFIAESCNVILRALKDGYEPLSLVAERRRLEEALLALTLMEDAENKENGNREPELLLVPNSGGILDVLKFMKDVPIYTSDIKALDDAMSCRLTGGVLCAMRRKPLPDAADVCRDAKRVIVLEKVMNPINVGSIFRSAAALEIDAVLLTAGCADPLYRRSSRVSMGTTFQIPWTYLDVPEDNRDRVRPSAEYPGRYVKALRDMGFKCAALALDDNSVSIEDEQLLSEDRLAIIMGTEGTGLFPETIEDCDYTVKIPMGNGVDSLNVAAASAIAIWKLTENRRK